MNLVQIVPFQTHFTFSYFIHLCPFFSVFIVIHSSLSDSNRAPVTDIHTFIIDCQFTIDIPHCNMTTDKEPTTPTEEKQSTSATANAATESVSGMFIPILISIANSLDTTF
jgi:hypothetical protein